MTETAENYVSTQKDENVEIAYYFPLRNEKNVKFLENHQQYLEGLMEMSSRRVQKNEAIKDSLRHMCTMVKKDIQIFQTRLISIRKVFENATSAESKAETAMHNAFNIQSNVRLKIHLINSMKSDYNQEYARFYDTYREEEENKVAFVHPDQFHREVPSECRGGPYRG